MSIRKKLVFRAKVASFRYKFKFRGHKSEEAPETCGAHEESRGEMERAVINGLIQSVRGGDTRREFIVDRLGKCIHFGERPH
jgi:hypothetical protein